MDGNRFDALTKSLATPRTRRGVLKTLGAGLAAGLGALGIGGAGAAPGGQGKGGGGGGNRCGGPGQPCKWNKQCCEYSGLVCLNGTCGCEENFCSTTGACMPECTDGKVFKPDSCSCACEETSCCDCNLESGGDVCLGSGYADFSTCEEACIAEAGVDFHRAFFTKVPGASYACLSSQGICLSTCQT